MTACEEAHGALVAQLASGRPDTTCGIVRTLATRVEQLTARDARDSGLGVVFADSEGAVVSIQADTELLKSLALIGIVVGPGLGEAHVESQAGEVVVSTGHAARVIEPGRPVLTSSPWVIAAAPILGEGRGSVMGYLVVVEVSARASLALAWLRATTAVIEAELNSVPL